MISEKEQADEILKKIDNEIPIGTRMEFEKIIHEVGLSMTPINDTFKTCLLVGFWLGYRECMEAIGEPVQSLVLVMKDKSIMLEGEQ